MRMKTRPNLRFIAALLVLLAALGVGVHFVHGFQNKRTAQGLLWQANQAKDAADSETEIDYLNRYEGFVPDDIDAQARLGVLFDERAKKNKTRKERIDAYERLENVLRHAPDRRDIRRRQVDTAMALPRFPDALAHLKVLLQAEPKNAELEQLAGMCEQGLEKFDRAVEWFQKAIQHAPDRIESYQRLAGLYRGRLEKPDEADKVMDSMIAANPRSPQARVARARYHLAQRGKAPGALEKAAADVRAVQERDRQEPEVVLVAADIARAQNNPEEARKLLSAGIEANPREARLYVALVSLEARDNKRSEALKVVRQGLKHLPDHGELLYALADLLIQQDDLKETEAIIARLREPKYASLHLAYLPYLQARVHVRKGEWSEAGPLLDKGQRQFARVPGLDAQALLLLGLCHEQLSNLDQALLAYEQVQKLDPLLVTAHVRAGSVLITLGQAEKAVVQFERAMACPKIPPGLHILLARSLIAANLRLPLKDRDLEGITRELTLAAKEAPDSAEVTILRAEALLLKDPKQTDAARTSIEKARDARPDQIELWLALAQLAGRDGKRADALGILDQARARQKLAERVELRLARLSYLTFSPAELARRTLAEMEKEAAKLPVADRSRLFDGLAGAYLRLGDTAEAGRLWKKVIEQQSNNLRLRLVLFDLALAARSDAEITGLLREIKRIEGDNGVFWRYGEASHRVQRARPKDKEAVSDSGRRLLREGRKYLAEAQERRPKWSRIPALGAEIDELEGKVPAAIDNYLQAIELGERRPALVRRTVQLLGSQLRFKEARDVVRKLLDQERTLMSAGLGKLLTEERLSNPNPESRDLEHILALARNSVQADSKNYQDHLWLGQILWAIGKQDEAHQKVRFDEADKALRQACACADAGPETWVALVGFLSDLKKKKEAEAVIEEARKKLPRDRAPGALAACYEIVGNLPEADKQMQKALADRSNDPRMRRSAAVFYLRYNQPAKAEPHLRAILAPDSKASSADVAWGRRNLALILASGGDRKRYDEALGLIERNLREGKDAVEDQHAKALLLAARTASRKQAIDLFEDLANRGSLSATERFTLARLHLADSNWSKAQSHMQTLLASPEGKSPVYQAFYVRRLLQHGEKEEAEEQLAELEKTAPDAPLTKEIKARVLQAKGKDTEALDVLRGYAQSKGVDLGEAAVLVETFGLQGDSGGLYRKQAEEMYRKHVAQSKKPERFLLLASFLGRQHSVDKALDCCEEALRNNAAPVAVIRVMIGVVRDGEGEAEQCRRVERRLNEARTKDPNSIALLLYLADLSDFQGRYEKAKELYREVLGKDGANVIALNNLAWMLSFKEATKAEALDMINQVIARAGPSPELLDTRGIIYLNRGRSDKAIEDLQVCVAQAPTAVHYFHLAHALVQASKRKPEGKTLREAAVKALREAQDRKLRAKQLHPYERRTYKELLVLLDMK